MLNVPPGDVIRKLSKNHREKIPATRPVPAAASHPGHSWQPPPPCLAHTTPRARGRIAHPPGLVLTVASGTARYNARKHKSPRVARLSLPLSPSLPPTLLDYSARGGCVMRRAGVARGPSRGRGRRRRAAEGSLAKWQWQSRPGRLLVDARRASSARTLEKAC